MANKYDYVVPRYKENITNILDSKLSTHFNLNIIIYNKGPNITNHYDRNNIKIINLHNIGRDAHTVLYHIIQNYDSLAEVTVFGSMCGEFITRRNSKVIDTIDLVKKTKNSVFVCEGNLRSQKDFFIDDYSTSNPLNRHSSKLVSSDIRPFGNWYDRLWPDCPVDWTCYTIIFAVHKEHILQKPKEYYIQLINHVNKHENSESIHYIERAITSIFWPYPIECVYMYCAYIFDPRNIRIMPYLEALSGVRQGVLITQI
jgi:hypothetical protein